MMPFSMVLADAFFYPDVCFLMVLTDAFAYHDAGFIVFADAFSSMTLVSMVLTHAFSYHYACFHGSHRCICLS